MTNYQSENFLADLYGFKRIDTYKYRHVNQYKFCGQELHVWMENSISKVWKRGYFIRGEYCDVSEFDTMEEALANESAMAQSSVQ